MLKHNIILLLLSLSLYSTGSAQEMKNDIHKDIILMNDIKSENLSSLKDMIGNSRIVMLGEVDHSYGNIFEAKIKVMKYLHQEMGFDIIAFESGFYDLKKASEEMEQRGNIKLCMAKSIFPIWINTKEFLPFIKYIEENNSELLLTGFDSQFSGEYVFENLKDDFRKFVENEVSAEVLDSWIDHIETMSDDFQFVNDSSQFNLFNKHTSEIRNVLLAKKNYLKSDEEEIDFLIQLLHNIQQTASDYYINKTGTKSEKEWKAKDSNVRDQLMAENLIFLAKKYPNKKIICWGATAHFANKVWKLKHEELKSFTPMGSHIKKQLGEDQVYILGFTAAKDKSQNICSIEQEFNKKDARFGFLDLKSSTGKTQFKSYCIDLKEAAVYGDWKEVIDGMFFLDTITKSTHYLLDLDFESNSSVLKDISPDKKTDQKNLITNRQNIFSYQIIRERTKDMIIHSGKVEDSKTKQAIPYVNIGIRNTLIGTSADFNGNFYLKIPSQYQSDTISFSCIGYQTERIAVKDLSSRKNIALSPATENIEEVTVYGEPLTAKLIMKRVIKNIKHNYIQTPYSQLRLYRQKRWSPYDEKFYLQEELRSIYDNNGYKSVPMYPIRYEGFNVSKQGRIAVIDTITGSTGKFRNKQTKIIAPIGLSDVVNMRYNNFLNRSKLSKYEFEIKKSISTDTGEQLLIAFRAKKPRHRTTAQLAPIDYSGTITINANDYAIVKVNSTTIQDKNKIWLAKRTSAYYTEKAWFKKEIVSYKKYGNYYYLEKIHRTSNHDFRYIYFTDIIGLEVKEGKLPRPKKGKYHIMRTEEAYNPADWKFLKESF
ncbi:hypothetical protein EMN47_17210 [Prolixibacteraceae bacterium JC049]|nr:hypothetical protein [Prolixibacteraceae bacterium JC049]